MSLRLTSISGVNSPFLPLRIIMNLSGVPNGGGLEMDHSRSLYTGQRLRKDIEVTTEMGITFE